MKHFVRSGLVCKLQAKNIRLFPATSAVTGKRNNNSNRQDDDLNLYSKIIRKLAGSCGLIIYLFTL